jgi:hypothetical protein
MQEFAEQGVHTLLIIVNTGWFSMEKAVKKSVGEVGVPSSLAYQPPIKHRSSAGYAYQKKSCKKYKVYVRSPSKSRHVYLERHSVEHGSATRGRHAALEAS